MAIITDQLQFPEGPVALADGSVLVVEIARGTLSRVDPTGAIDVVAETGGGPNGAAIGPEGKCFICNNGGFNWIRRNGRIYPGDQADDYSGGRIERVDIESGEVEVLYEAANGVKLRGPNDLVFDNSGGFWFTDHGKNRPRDRDRTGVFYAKADGSFIEEVIFPLEAPNGIGLSADNDELYIAETPTGRLWAYPLRGPGQLKGERLDRPDGGRVVKGRNSYFMFDSLAVDADGGVCVATLIDGGVTTLYPDGREPKFVSMPDRLTTNVCFGGEELKTAYVTLSSIGQLVALDWDVGGLPLNYLNL
ncbi:MAG: SMP-30/gluconolactonase/LRE family protein [Gammaproteobacteria bacterium]|nr:SMP-30/gluconolactonase/LRE family protein [Gammaproteobacteria bacterium]